MLNHNHGTSWGVFIMDISVHLASCSENSILVDKAILLEDCITSTCAGEDDVLF